MNIRRALIMLLWVPLAVIVIGRAAGLAWIHTVAITAASPLAWVAALLYEKRDEEMTQLHLELPAFEPLSPKEVVKQEDEVRAVKELWRKLQDVQNAFSKWQSDYIQIQPTRKLNLKIPDAPQRWQRARASFANLTKISEETYLWLCKEQLSIPREIRDPAFQAIGSPRWLTKHFEYGWWDSNIDWQQEKADKLTTQSYFEEFAPNAGKTQQLIQRYLGLSIT